jgi:hypothetical protein
MLRRIIAAILIAAAFGTAATAVPGVVESVTHACDRPDCG